MSQRPVQAILPLQRARLGFVGANDKVSGVARRTDSNHVVSVDCNSPGRVLATAEVGQIFSQQAAAPRAYHG